MKTKYAIAALFFPFSVLFSVTAVWMGPSGSNWSTGASWVGGTPPTAAGDTATFNNIGGGGAINLNVNENSGTLNFDFNMPYTLATTGGTLTLVNSPATNAALINITTVNGAAAHTISASLTLGSPLTVSQGSSSDFTISGAITGAQTLTLVGSGTGRLILSAGGGNTYSGGTSIANGILSVSQENQLGTGNITIGSATLQYTNGAPLTSTHNINLAGSSTIDTSGAGTVTIGPGTSLSGTGSLTKVGTGGALVLAGANTYQSGTTLSAGTLSISNDNQLGATAGPLNLGTGTLITTAALTSARSGSITGAPATLNTMGFTDTFSGNFGGGGSLNITGGGTVIFSGTNSYSGGTTVTSSTLQGTTNGVQGNISLTAGSNLIFNQSTNGTYSGAISSAAPGNGALSLQGSGTITFTGNSTGFSGPTSLTGGSLFVNGSLANSSVTVAGGTTLGGSGSVGATTNNGTLSPGGTLTTTGALAVTGSLTLTGASNVHINVSPSSASSLIVSGTAFIDGALTVDPAPGFYGFDTSYTILTSAGLLNVPPGFSSISSTNPSFSPTVTYNSPPGSIVLSLNVAAPFANFPFSNRNTRAVGGNIDQLFASGQLTGNLFNVIQSFAAQSNSDINDALDQMHPASYSAFTEILSETDGKLVSLFHRLPYLSYYFPDRANRLWAQPFGDSLTLKSHGIQFGAQSNTGGIAFGYDREISDPLYIGIGGAWANTHMHWHDHHGHGEVNELLGSFYIDYQTGAFYIGGTVLAGLDFFDTSRRLEFFTTETKAKADFNALDIVGQVQMAYLFGSPLAYFYPYLNLDFLYLHTYDFQENGAGGLNLSVQARSDSTLRTEMGLALQVQDINAAETMTISPEVSIGWVNMCPIQRDSFHSSFVGTSIPFTTHGWDKTWNLFEVDFGLSFGFYNFSLSFNYDIEFSPDHHTLFFNQYGNILFEFFW